METLSRIFGKEARVAELNAQIDALFAQSAKPPKAKDAGWCCRLQATRCPPSARNRGWQVGYTATSVCRPWTNLYATKGTGSPFPSNTSKRKPRLDFHHRPHRRHRAGRVAAVEVLDNALVCGTNAWKRKQIIVMPAANYIVAGGARQLIQAAEQLKAAFEKAEPVAAQ